MQIENAFLIHGSFGSPDENWMPWLKERLERNRIAVYAPQFPIEERQSFKSWLAEFDRYRGSLNGNSIMVGHSLGSAFIFRVLEKVNTRILGCFLVAPFSREIRIPKYDEVNKTFLEKEFDWDRIRRNCEHFYIYGSDNDPYVKSSQEHFVAEKTGGALRMIPGAGHFNESSGYKEFRELYEDIATLY
ncbi:MAG: serine hydrolase family protein [Candidatus Micrarchaeota archaeon]|nr:serine hydrolase family protein [Candidatus Micrarchaeota archaeon]